eukprot:750653-Hanusia_phi.AAC.1
MAVGWDGRAAFAELRLSIAVSFCSSLTLLRQLESFRHIVISRARGPEDSDSEPRSPGPAGLGQPGAAWTIGLRVGVRESDDLSLRGRDSD